MCSPRVSVRFCAYFPVHAQFVWLDRTGAGVCFGVASPPPPCVGGIQQTVAAVCRGPCDTVAAKRDARNMLAAHQPGGCCAMVLGGKGFWHARFCHQCVPFLAWGALRRCSDSPVLPLLAL